LKEPEAHFFELISKATDSGQQVVFPKHRRSEAYDRACVHIEKLLTDAMLLHEAGSWSRATFLAITAMEECAKLAVGLYRAEAQPKGRRRGDPLFSHGDKHRLAFSPTILLGGRLEGKLGRKRVQELLALIYEGKLVDIREDCLYFSATEDTLKVPEDVIDEKLCQALLLLAIEICDDSLVGLTNYSFEVGKHLESLFLRVAGG